MWTQRSDELLSNIRRIMRAISMHSKALLRQYGLTAPQLMILNEVGRSRYPTVSEIARRVSLSQATVTNILSRLEQQGFVLRQRGETDKRKVYVEATEKTRRILQARPSLLQDDFVDRFNRLEDWEQSLLVSSVQRIATMMGAQEIEAPPLLYSESLQETGGEGGEPES